MEPGRCHFHALVLQNTSIFQKEAFMCVPDALTFTATALTFAAAEQPLRLPLRRLFLTTWL